MHKYRLLMISAVMGFAATPFGFGQQLCTNGVEDSISTPNNDLLIVTRTPCKGNAGREVLFIGIHDSALRVHFVS
jgi:hypothetical protein